MPPTPRHISYLIIHFYKYWINKTVKILVNNSYSLFNERFTGLIMEMILKCATAWIIVVQHLISCIRRGVFSNIFIFFNELLLLLLDTIHFLSWYINLSDLCGICMLRITLLNANLLAHFSLNFSEQKSILLLNHF